MLNSMMDIPSFYTDEVSALASFKKLGLHVEYSFFSAVECDEIVIASKKLTNSLNGEYRPSLNPHTESDVFLKVLQDKRLIKVMEKLIGGRISGIQTQLFFGKPGTKGFSIHQDNFFVEVANADDFVSTWLALEDATKENGTIFAYPGAHKEGLLPVRKLTGGLQEGQEYNAANEECIVPPQYPSISVEVPKGTLVFLHSLVPHGSFDNVSQSRWRHVMLNNYIKSGVSFRPGNSAKRSEIPVYE